VVSFLNFSAPGAYPPVLRIDGSTSCVIHRLNASAPEQRGLRRGRP
jgi:hypothetical protein